MTNLFTLNALRNFKQTGSLFRSSKSLAKKLVKPLNSEKPLNIIELGAGDGVVTKYILNKISNVSRLHSFEINENFIFKLNKIKDDRLVIHHACVSNLKSTFSENEIDYVISSLPLANIKHLFKEELIQNIKYILKPKGILIQYQYAKTNLKLLKYNFPKTNTSLCIQNLPPAFIYNCTNAY
ncbi:MAG: rRNA adenine N-6-methyltransferase family protein [Algibacter sp.]